MKKKYSATTNVVSESDQSVSEHRSRDTEETAKAKKYNILSIDGGGVRGIIPAMVVDYMEREAYKYAISKNYIEKNERQKYPMS